ncbi:cob(I)yrinic acid a,c-diamide adenosyltransferase [Aquisalimonas lutea]|uniref:cob(I)yrinic acid a,c-diamide adenosyltransferase n=1 Tax=Aquisalimonas lutea TaxID=1327750 RepID=UPI0025B60059|nr:cob(I)yrinic acid a,c-diamide adenosyltransferase [Aquisalimonas lutea]MDN3516730.1 cob(I)yrinic acid a,c-diamide adenosyltransferase [Aquisalimonas lutea]
MVRITKVYTRTGDAGTTMLGDGSRVEKHSPRVVAYGDVDEANAALGVACTSLQGEIHDDIRRIQNDLFDVGADLCTPEGDAEAEKTALRVVDAQVTWLEERMDALNESLPPLRSFILPGGDSGAAALHMARTIVRRAEREIAELAGLEAINPAAVRYMNRLSDYLFVSARYVNAGAEGDVLWVPGKHR